MVKKKNAMVRNLQRSISRSLGRYLAIMAIIALGSGMFVGLRMTKVDMVATGQRYMDQQNMFDLRLISTYGWSKDQAAEAAALPGVADAEGQFYVDAIADWEGMGTGNVYRFYSIPERIDVPVLLGGRMPQTPEECLADGLHTDDSVLGTQITVTADNDPDTLELLNSRTFTVVGYVASPLYMDLNRGNTSVGNGSISNYVLLPGDAFSADYDTEIHLTITGDRTVYTDAYNDRLEAMADDLEVDVSKMAGERFDDVIQNAREALAEGEKQYADGVHALEDGRREAEEQLAQAEEALAEGEKELQTSREMLWRSGMELDSGEKDLDKAQEKIDAGWASLDTEEKNAYAQLDEKEAELNAMLPDLESNRETLQAALWLAEGARDQAALTVRAMTGMSPEAVAAEVADTQASIAELEAQLDQTEDPAQRLWIQAQITTKQTRVSYLEGIYSPYSQAQAQVTQLQSQQAQLLEGIAQVEDGLAQIQYQRETGIPETFAQLRGELENGQKQVDEGRADLELARQQIANGWAKLEAGRAELEEGRQALEDERQKAMQELADGEAELQAAAAELEEAREKIAAMEEPDYYILDRNSNLGYNSLDSSSDIVAGVSRVFPVFFLLVAALVCITTMTRMVEEERTQIGTLKALGYSSGAIIGKYMAYAVSSAVLGCGVGVLAGGVIFPTILWQAYRIMLFIPGHLTLRMDWGLCAGVVASYTAVIAFVTWYCCHRSLREVPAELIRPKAPTAGKQLLFERLPFWNRVSFLNKVTVRNIFRYRQRLVMMLVGIGGCTALLLTGFGIRDSIANVADFQFEEITLYDMSVQFSQSQSMERQDSFRDRVPGTVVFGNQSSVELTADQQTREIYLITAGADIQQVMDFHKGETPLSLPGQGETLLSSGVAESLGIRVGDTVTVRTADMESMELTVSGIYDNHVYNYALITPETYTASLGREVPMQIAYVTAGEGENIYELSAQITAMKDVLNVTVNKDLADMVGSMMDALDLVVIVVVLCAALLAAIVLYNLTNINITERLREIATIKVLGFRAGETATYIFKENLILTVVGAALGLGAGKLLMAFVMSQIKIDFVWFQARLMVPSYLWSVLLTLLITLLVDWIFYHRLEKINMAEALKSVE